MELSLLKTEVNSAFKVRRVTGMIGFIDLEGVSSDNEYIPLFAIKANLGIYNKTIMHYAVSFKRTVRPMINYALMYRALEIGSVAKVFKTRAMVKELFVMKGLIVEKTTMGDFEPLFVITLKTNYVKQIYKDEEEGRPLNLSNYAIFVSTKFCTSAEFKSVYNKVYKEVILPYAKIGVDVIITNNVAEKCFNVDYEGLNFKTINEMQNYFDALNKEI